MTNGRLNEMRHEAHDKFFFNIEEPGKEGGIQVV